MKTLELQLPDDVAAEVERLAAERGVAVEELLRLSVEEKLARDGRIESAVAYVLDKNFELYRRLS